MKVGVKLGLVFTLMLFVSCGAETKIDSKDPMLSGVIQKGTLCNNQLIHDTMLPFMAKLGTLGCDKVDSYQPYVLQMPEGEVGSRVWKERWIAKSGDKLYPVDIIFKENLFGASMTIK